MFRSMTAFARHEQTSVWGAIIWELRSVHHRYLEASIRLPETAPMPMRCAVSCWKTRRMTATR